MRLALRPRAGDLAGVYSPSSAPLRVVPTARRNICVRPRYIHVNLVLSRAHLGSHTFTKITSPRLLSDQTSIDSALGTIVQHSGIHLKDS